MSDKKGVSLIAIEKEMSDSYLDYAMSVIVSRAIPDVCDGLKPVHRRILYAMYESRCFHNMPYRKSARVVGEVLGKYHPHGDTAVYDALVRMAQTFSMREPLIDGQGNFGSMDGDSAAAMRYTESKLKKISMQLLSDLDKDTVDFVDNYDGSEKEPVVLPSRFPNLLVNGSNGIAVGMATNIPPHNLGEVIDATIAYINNNDIQIEEILEHISGPDFPTGGIILGKTGIVKALQTGRGSITIRSKTKIESLPAGREAIIVTEIPYQVNKSRLIEKIAELVRDKRVEGISDLRDESDRHGVRVVIELKRAVMTDVALSQLFSYSQLQVSYGINMLALNNKIPEQMGVLDVIRIFVQFRERVVVRRLSYLLNKARNKAHVLIGLTLAVDSIDEVIVLIRASKDSAEAREKLLSKTWNAREVLPLIKLVDDRNNKLIEDKCYFTNTQVQAILDMRLAKLTGLERNKIEEELKGLSEEIKEFLELLANRNEILNIIKSELRAVKDEFATERRTEISTIEFEQDIEDLIPEEDMVVTITIDGYIKRQPISSYRAQKRGGKGKVGIKLKEEAVVIEMFVASTHSYVLFFSNRGRVYRMKTYKLPISSAQSKGRAFVNLLPLESDEIITNVMSLPRDELEWDNLNLMFATKNGNIRRSNIEDFRRINVNGKIAIKLDENDFLIGVQSCKDTDHVMLATKSGKNIRFSLEKIRVIKSRSSSGIRGIKLKENDQVISLTIIQGIVATRDEKELYLKIDVQDRLVIKELMHNEEDSEQLEIMIKNYQNLGLDEEKIKLFAKQEDLILSITENGYGKRTSSYAYSTINRGGSGVINIITSERNGEVVACFPVDDDDDVMLITDKGKLIRSPVKNISISGRSTQGVTIIKVAKGEKVVSVARVDNQNTDEFVDEEDGSQESGDQEDSSQEKNA